MGVLGAAVWVLVLLFAALYFITDWGMLRLNGWSRIVTMVLAGLVILRSLFGLTRAFMHSTCLFSSGLPYVSRLQAGSSGNLFQSNVSAAFNGGQTRTVSA